MTPRVGEGLALRVGVAVAEIVGLAETITDWVPAVVPFWHITMTVYVPGLTFAQAADWRLLVPVNRAWRPWAKPDCPPASSDAWPKLPLAFMVGHALVVTVTVDPVVLTEIPVCAAAGAARASGSAAAAARVRPERRSV
jgi:hypothetical protein